MLLAIEKTFTRQLTILCDHYLLTPDLATNVVKQYHTMSTRPSSSNKWYSLHGSSYTFPLSSSVSGLEAESRTVDYHRLSCNSILAPKMETICSFSMSLIRTRLHVVTCHKPVIILCSTIQSSHATV